MTIEFLDVKILLPTLFLCSIVIVHNLTHFSLYRSYFNFLIGFEIVRCYKI